MAKSEETTPGVIFLGTKDELYFVPEQELREYQLHDHNVGEAIKLLKEATISKGNLRPALWLNCVLWVKPIPPGECCAIRIECFKQAIKGKGD
jgi:hypothetical protein